MRPPLVLYVDDEAGACKYFQRAMAGIVEVVVAGDATEALAVLAEHDDRIAVVVSDHRMPGESGASLLANISQSRPGVVRILTTAYADLDSAVSAVNEGRVYRYVFKPWNLDELRITVRQALEHAQLRRERDQLLAEKLEALQRLVVLDRVRSYSVLALGMANRLKNPLQALQAFLECAPIEPQEQVNDEGIEWASLWAMARTLTQQLLRAMQEAIDTTLQVETSFADTDLGDLVSRCAVSSEVEHPGWSIAIACECEHPHVAADTAMIERVVSGLFRRLAMVDDGPQRIHCTLSDSQVWGTEGVCLRIRAESDSWSHEQLQRCFAISMAEAGSASAIDLLSAFFIAFHHAGKLVIQRDAPRGPGFELVLPRDPDSGRLPDLPEDCLERVFTHYVDLFPVS